MAEVILASASEKQVWTNKFLLEYVRESSFLPYMGTSASSIIRIRNELQQQGGAYLNVPLITRLKGRGVRGAEVLKGNEDDLGNYNDQVRIDWIRNAVKVPKSTSYKTDIDLFEAAKPQLRTWDAEVLRDDVIDAFASIIIKGNPDANGIAGTDSAVLYDQASAAQRNAFLVNNKDRILFGSSKSNSSSNVWATSLANVDSTNDKLSASTITLAKRMARTAGQTTGSINIRPFKSDMTAGREWFVLFANSLAFRDLTQDQTIINANTQARAREGDGMERNPLFQDGDLIYNGVIIREVPELPVITGAGAGGIDVGMSFLCGQSAIAVAYGQDPMLRVDLKEDYEFRPGVAIEELRGQKKVSYNGVQYGCVTLINSAVADA
jgi:N4-gp56 family major capsid protein